MSEMRVGYLECFAGISGDMLMAALVEAGAPVDLLQRSAASLGLGAELRISKVNRSGIQSTKIDVVVDGRPVETAALSGPHDHPLREHAHDGSHHHHAHDSSPSLHSHAAPVLPTHAHEHPADGHDHAAGSHSHGRTLGEIRTILQHAPISQVACDLAIQAFELLAAAEAGVHGVSIEKVHFHEVGAVDAIVDIACCAVAVDALGLDRWYCSPVNVGSGFVNCMHGRFPVPAPATASLLMNVPVYSAGPPVEMTTPTGAALLRAMQCRFEAPGVMRANSISYGAGTRNPERFPNVLRLTVGTIEEKAWSGGKAFPEEELVVLECAVDDLSPQVLAHAAQLAMEMGALDVMSAPVTMKKGRLGTLVTVLSRPADAGRLQQLLFRETTTLGIRLRTESRVFLKREIIPVETEFGVIGVKVGAWNGEELNAAPEFEDCRRAAERGDIPLKTVMQAAVAEWRRKLPAGSGARAK
ncbi:MAG TPA: nickel pincer cofactor biosynthesis protein LarC [Acidobacteriaceae bacterium]|nr:nickel pincer cofactor biosynthesis protein LarC [Acidobacteriaceae bacterium]